MPALYLSHGAPPLVDDELWVSQLAAWASELPAPTAILVVSAHWEAAPLTIGSTTTETPLTYDFWGFPQRYYDVTYDAPGAPDLAARIEALMPDDEPVAHDPDRRLDHGAYVPLTVMYPDATHSGAADLDADAGPATAAAPRRAASSAARRRRTDHRFRIHHPRSAVPGRPVAGRHTAGVVGGVRRVGAGAVRRRRPRRAHRLSRTRRPACPMRTRRSSTSRRCSSRSGRRAIRSKSPRQVIDGYWMGLAKRSIELA